MSRSMLRRFVAKLAAIPSVFDLLRWTLEGGYRGHRQLIAAELSGTEGRVLDIGCGTGIYAGFFPPESYTGIDLSAIYTEACAKKHPRHSFLTMNATQLAFEDDSFASAFVSGVLHHLPDDDAVAVIGEALRVLRPGGVLVIWEDIPAPWWNLVGHGILALDLGAHIRTVTGYQDLLHRASSVATVNARTTTMRSGFMDYAVFVVRT